MDIEYRNMTVVYELFSRFIYLMYLFKLWASSVGVCVIFREVFHQILFVTISLQIKYFSC
jgi:hypothetical protein